VPRRTSAPIALCVSFSTPDEGIDLPAYGSLNLSRQVSTHPSDDAESFFGGDLMSKFLSLRCPRMFMYGPDRRLPNAQQAGLTIRLRRQGILALRVWPSAGGRGSDVDRSWSTCSGGCTSS